MLEIVRKAQAGHAETQAFEQHKLQICSFISRIALTSIRLLCITKLMNDSPVRQIPPPPPTKSFLQRFALLGKVSGIVLLALLQLIPLALVDGLLTERLARRDQATQEITSTWGDDQQVIGPVLIVPYRYYYTEKKEVLVDNRTVLQDTETSQVDNAYFLPAHLNIEGSAIPKRLHKGIYQAVVYDATLDLSGDFAAPDFAPFKLGKFDILWDQASLAVPIHDLRGVQETLAIHLGDSDLPLLPGSTLKFYPQGIHADIPHFTAPTGPLPFHLKISVRGSDSLQFAPIGVENTVHLTSPWPDPSFTGGFLPAERKVTPLGFDATWRISYYGRNFQQQWRGADTPLTADDLTSSYYGVGFLTLIDSYRNVERSIKYGILFIVLVFITFFLFEILARLRLHLIQYSLVSAALMIFYLALLSLSEFVSFGFSYVIAAGISTLLITGYCSRILGSGRLALGLSTGLAAVYGALYVILQLEDYSLLVGTAVLVVALGAIMYVTRNVNWYGNGTA
jgi:inner membrane protein